MPLSDPVLLAVLGGIGAGFGLLIRDLIAQRDRANERADKYLDMLISSTRVADHLASAKERGS